MIRSIPFNFRNNAEKTRDTVERVVDFIMEQPLNPIGKVTGALASFRCLLSPSRAPCSPWGLPCRFPCATGAFLS